MYSIRSVLTLLVVLADSASLHAELTIRWEVDGRALPLVAVAGDQLLLQDGDKRVPAGSTDHWTVTGNLRESAGLLQWTPTYAISRFNGADIAAKPRNTWHGFIHVMHRTTALVPGKPATSWVLSNWPQAISGPAAVLMLWVVGEDVRHVAVRPVPEPRANNNFTVDVSFPLTEEEAAHGHAAIGIWSAGSLIAPRPLFEDANEQQAFLGVVLDDAVLPPGVGKGRTDDAQEASLAHLAADFGSTRALQALLANEPAHARAKQKDKQTPLHLAAAKGRTEAIAALLAAKAAVDAEGGPDVITPLMSAVRSGQTAAVGALLAAGANARAESQWHQSALGDAVDAGYGDIATMLQAAGARLPPDGKQLSRVLISQARLGHTSVVRFLLDQRTSPNADVRGANALFAAATPGDPELADLLIAAKVKIDESNADGITPLMAAAMRGHAAFALRLLSAGADVNRQSKAGGTALYYAAANNASNVVRALLDHGANASLRAGSKVAPLEIALITLAPDSARIIAEYNPAIDLTLPFANDVLAAAIHFDVEPVVSWALDHGWPADTTFHDGWPALHVAEVFDAGKVATLLRKAGAQVAPEDLRSLATAGELDAPLKLLQRAMPEDTRDADDIFPAQTVLVDFIVDQDGSTCFPQVHETPDARLSFSVVAALSQWRFAPPTRQTRPVAVKVRVPVEFPPSSSRAFKLQDLDEMPQAIKRVPPVYPLAAKLGGAQARVTVRFVINTEGIPTNIRCIETSGPDFIKPAIDAIEQWRFSPGKRDGKPVNVEMAQPIVFSISQ